jgi:hypothetical protein
MERRDLDEITRFLTSVGKPSLFAYYGASEATDAVEMEALIKKRRAWAQGQQANPKFKEEALFLIKNNKLLRGALLEDREAYVASLRDADSARALHEIEAYIRGAIAGGVLTQQGETAVQQQGRTLGASESAIRARIDFVLAATGARRADPGADDDGVSPETSAIDFYALLDLPSHATLPQIEAAYRAKYRWARSLKDLARSAEVLLQLDDAWRVLAEPSRRRRYDELRAAMAPAPAFSPPLPDPGEDQETELISLKDVRAAMAAPPPEPPTLALSLSDGAPPQPNIQGRTIGLGTAPQPVRDRAPRLGIKGNTTSVRATLPRGRTIVTLTVENVGQGRMPGRLNSDAEWLVPLSPRLDPNAREQSLAIAIDTRLMPRSEGVAHLTVVADHGERRVVTYAIQRRDLLRPVLAVAGVMASIVVAAGVAWFAWQSAPPDAVPTEALLLRVDPLADHVLVDGRDVGGGRELTVQPPAPNQPFLLRLETDGFRPHEEQVSPLGGSRLERSIVMELADEPAWSPPAGAEAVVLEGPAVEAAGAARGRLARCVAELDLAAPMKIGFRAFATPDGHVRRVDIVRAEPAPGRAEACLRRVWRGLRLPPFTGDYGTLDVPMELEAPR